MRDDTVDVKTDYDIPLLGEVLHAVRERPSDRATVLRGLATLLYAAGTLAHDLAEDGHKIDDDEFARIARYAAIAAREAPRNHPHLRGPKTRR